MPIGHLWWVKRTGGPQGPFPTTVIEENIMRGRVLGTDQLSPDGEHWTPASEYPDFDVLAASVRSKLVARRLDDRRSDRRRPSREISVEAGQREGGDRRAAEDPAVVVSRERSNRVWNSLRPQRPNARYLPYLLLAAVTTIVFVVSINWSGGERGTQARCAAQPAQAINWEYCVNDGRDLHATDLQAAILRNGHLAGADLSGADLRGADLAYADLKGALLRGARLEGARLTGAVLRDAILEGANLDGADLAFADLKNALLSGAKLQRANFDRTILPSGRQCTDSASSKCAGVALRP